MRKEQQKIVDCFVDLLTEEIVDCVKQCESINELKQYHNILIVCSAKNHVLHLLVGQIANMSEHIKMNVLGNKGNDELRIHLSDRHENIKYHNYTYEGRFSVERVMPYREIIMTDNPDLDAVLFLNSDLHSENYLNVEEVVEILAEKKKLPIYAYNVSGDLYKYRDVKNHRNSIQLYSQLVRWFHANSDKVAD